MVSKISTTTQEDHWAVPSNVNPETLYLGVHATETNEFAHQKTCQRIFKALFTMAIYRKQIKCLSTVERINTLINGTKTLDIQRQFTEETRLAKKCMKRCSALKLKPQWDIILHPSDRQSQCQEIHMLSWIENNRFSYSPRVEVFIGTSMSEVNWTILSDFGMNIYYKPKFTSRQSP